MTIDDCIKNAEVICNCSSNSINTIKMVRDKVREEIDSNMFAHNIGYVFMDNYIDKLNRTLNIYNNKIKAMESN